MKRFVDFALGALALVLAAPPMAAIAIAVRLIMGAPTFFRQRRIGLNGESFTLVKFRTMRGGPGLEHERLTSLGRFLRSTSLDELPQLWNVVRGEMSLVGPRPLPVAYLDRYTPEQARRHEVSPGLTGWAQINGRNSTSWEERLALDVWYVDNRSLWLDVRILARTLSVVLRRQGISAAGEATMAELPPRPGGEGGAP